MFRCTAEFHAVVKSLSQTFSEPEITFLAVSVNYRVTIQLAQNFPLTWKEKFRFGLPCPGQNGTFLLKSTGGFEQV